MKLKRYFFVVAVGLALAACGHQNGQSKPTKTATTQKARGHGHGHKRCPYAANAHGGHGHSGGQGHGHAHKACPRAANAHGHGHKACPHAAKAHGHGHAHGDGKPYVHHTARHRFQNVKRWAKIFDNPKRDGWQKPKAVVAKLALDAKATVADLGAGTGYFTLHLARAVPQGKVLALDVEDNMVAHIKKRAKKAGLANVVAKKIASGTSGLPNNVDVVFLCNTYHHIDHRRRYFREVASKLAPKGKLVIVDFKGGKIPVGPPEAHRVLPPRVDKELTDAGLKRLELDEKTLPYQYIAVYMKR
jgi:ubiquinone/menaquinone biosynthesis C-methylase UbiE